jgi:solute:Na+ symporter, SSS family
MHPIDWLILIGYLVASLAVGLWLSRRNRSQADYFVAGRQLKGWLAGASMAATTFSVDTPLYVAGLVGTRGLAGNWEWWSFGVAHVAMAVVFAPLWRRSGVLTDAAFTELRYGGATAAWLRGIKAFLFAVPINCIGIGYAFLAMAKVSEALGLAPTPQARFTLLAIVGVLVLVYTAAGGLWAVVVTDMLQLVVALAGAVAVAVFAVQAAGGMDAMLASLRALDRPELLSLVPWQLKDGQLSWMEGAGISVPTFSAYIALQWWSFRRSDGGGEFIQRLLATRDERQARIASWVFLGVNYLLRSWPWIVVALAAVVLLPDSTDWEQSYPLLAVKLLPPVALGLVVVSLVAAFMSTVSTAVNWGASYLTHDLYQRFMRPAAKDRELLLVGQLASVVLVALGVLTALLSTNIGTVFRLGDRYRHRPWGGAGVALVLVARSMPPPSWRRCWAASWWASPPRWSRCCASTTTACGLLVTTVHHGGALDPGDAGHPSRASAAVLETFVRKVKPAGPGWAAWRRRCGVEPEETLLDLVLPAAGQLCAACSAACWGWEASCSSCRSGAGVGCWWPCWAA